jgi:hypothetical protein
MDHPLVPIVKLPALFGPLGLQGIWRFEFVLYQLALQLPFGLKPKFLFPTFRASSSLPQFMRSFADVFFR